MLRYWTILVFTILLCQEGMGQCPVADFTISSSACLGETLPVNNTSTGAQSYEWDFCSGDLALTPSATPVFTNLFLQRSRSFRIAKFNSEWVGFAIDQVNNKLLRFDFGSSPGGTPVMTNLDNPGGVLQNAYDFQLYKEGVNWYALVANTAGNNLVRFDFGTDLKSTPSAVNAGSFGAISTPNAIFVVNDIGSLHIYISNGSTSQNIVDLNFGSSITNTPSTSTIAISGSSDLRGIALIKECNRWFGLVTSYGNSKIFYLDFTSGLNQPPVTGELGLTAIGFPASLTLQHEGGSFFAFVQSGLGSVLRLNFGASIIDQTGTSQDLGNLGVSTDNFAMEWSHEGTDWYGFSIDNSVSSRLMRLTMPAACSATPAVEVQQHPVVYFEQSGTSLVTLRSFDASGNFSSMSGSVSISSVVAPALDFQSQGVCAQSPVIFTAQSSTTPSSFQWDFGNGNTSTQPSPSESFAAAGNYHVSLTAGFSNGCSNYVTKQVVIYSIPIADFTLPSSSPVCTNQGYALGNTSTFDTGSNPSWEWRLNGNLFSSQQDVSVVFNSETSQELRLKALLPGCESEMVKNIPTVFAGPIVNFDVSDGCQGSSTAFTNTTMGAVTGYSWIFGDGTGAVTENPAHTYAAAGTYAVVLTATNAAGCENFKQKSVQIYSLPQPDFSVGLPPFSCAKSPTPFQNNTAVLTDNNITGWSWSFGDPACGSSNQQSPSYTYATAADFNVMLTAFTDAGCSNAITKLTVISSSPSADFAAGPACLGQPTQFTDLSSGGIQSRIWQIGTGTFTSPNPAYVFDSSGPSAVSLTVTSGNGCSNVKTTTVSVPVPPAVNFTVVNPCMGKSAVFTDVTSSPQDAVAGWNWLFDGNSVTGNPAEFMFSPAGAHSAKLTTTHVSGCKYSLTKNITINPSPVASFTASPDRGAAPLTVQFLNASQNANAYSWKFNDKVPATSAAVSPAYTFTSLGDYSAELTATNVHGCSDVLTVPIMVLVPSVDLVMQNFTLVLDPVSGKLRPSVSILNNSNVPVSSAEIELFLADKAVVNETVALDLGPGQSATRSLSFTLTPTQFEFSFLCAEIASEKDVQKDNNKSCINLDSEDYIFSPYPNPTEGTVKLDWIAQSAGTARISVYDSKGGKLYEWETQSKSGLNQTSHDFSFLTAGVYFLTLETSTGRSTMRFMRQ